jgi:hypothetical protein
VDEATTTQIETQIRPPETHAKLRGHYQYYGINDNWPWLMKFRGQAKRLAFRWLNRRSQSMNWSEFYTYLERHELASPRKLTDLIAMR